MNVERLRTLAALLILILPAISTAQSDEDAAPEYSRSGADTCIACHGDEHVLAIFKTKHAVPTDSRGPFGQGQLQCEACHGPGGNHAGRVRRGQERPAMPYFAEGSTATIAEENGQCLDCHENAQGLAWHSGPHGGADVACIDCHNSHEAADPVLHTATQPEVCADCHQSQQVKSMKAFAHPMREGKMDCSSCHAVHGDVVASSLVRETVNDTCFQCHAETRGPYLWEHAPVSEDCTNCHEPHGSNHPGQLVRRGPLLCQSCHSQAGHPSVALQTDGLPSGMPSNLLLGQNCMNCHSQVHGSNHPSGSKLMR